jgi:hypothetical protein
MLPRLDLSAAPRWLSLLVCALPLVALACRRDPPARVRVPGPPVAERPALLATVTEVVPPAPSPPTVIGLHAPLAKPPWIELLFASRGGGVAFEVETEHEAYVVHNGRPGKTYAAVGDIAVSPDGAHVAHGALVEGRWRMIRDGEEGEDFDAVDAPVFSPDGAHLAYEAMSGEFWYLVVDGARYRSPTRFLAHAFSGDSSRIAFLEDFDPPARAQLVVSDLAFERPTVVAADLAGLVLDEEGARAASVSAAFDGEALLTVRLDAPERVTLGARYDAIREPAFAANGSVAYLAERGGARLVVLDEAEAPLPEGGVARGPLVVRGGSRGVGALVAMGGSVRLHELFTRERGAPKTSYEDAAHLTYDPSGRSHAFAASRGGRWLLVVNGNEGPSFDRVVTPRFSPDGKRVVYRARQDGRRFVVTADLRGRTTRRHPGFEQVFPLSFTADGRSVAYGAKDAGSVTWQVGAL